MLSNNYKMCMQKSEVFTVMKMQVMTLIWMYMLNCCDTEYIFILVHGGILIK